MACPSEAERWPDEAALRERAPGFEARILYVSPQGSQEGAGTREAPLTIQAALLQFQDGDIIALALGRYPSSVGLRQRVALLGACTEGTILEGESENSNASHIIVDTTASTHIADLSLTGAQNGVLYFSGAHTISSVALDQVNNIGILATGAGTSVVADGMAVTEVVAREGFFSGICALVVEGGALTLTRSDLAGCVGAGLAVQGEGSIVSAHDTRIGPGSGPGNEAYGVFVRQQGQAVLRRVVVEGSGLSGARVAESGRLDLEDVWIGRARQLGPDDVGLFVSQGGEVVGRRVGLEDNKGRSVVCVASTLDLEEVWVSATRADPESGAGAFALGEGCDAHLKRGVLHNEQLGVVGVNAEVLMEDIHIEGEPLVVTEGFLEVGVLLSGGDVRVRRIAIGRRKNQGIVKFEAEGLLDVEDMWAGDLSIRTETVLNLVSSAILATENTSASFKRVLLEDIKGTGVYFLDSEGVVMEDIHIRGVQTQLIEGRHIGGGALNAENSSLKITRMVASDIAAAGVTLSGAETSADLQDLHLARLNSNLALPDLGMGILMVEGAAATAARVSIEDAVTAGLFVNGGSVLDIEDLRVERVNKAPSSSRSGEGAGLVAQLDSRVTLRRAAISEAVNAGIHAGFRADVDLTDTIIFKVTSEPPRTAAGINVRAGSRVEAERLVIEDATHGILNVWRPPGPAVGEVYEGEPCEVSLTDTHILNLRSPRSTTNLATGVLTIGARARLTARRLHIEGVPGTGVHVYTNAEDIEAGFADRSSLDIEDLTLSDITDDLDEGRLWFGIGFLVSFDVDLVARRIHIADLVFTGMVIIENSQATIEDLIVEGITASECGEDCDDLGGFGFYFEDSTLSLDGFAITGSTQVGLLINGEVDVDLRDGRLHDNRIGVNIFEATVDIDEDFDNVRTFDNERDFQSDNIKPRAFADQSFVDPPEDDEVP